jgi:ABC-type antimicrobial peptide transport system permease subunit
VAGLFSSFSLLAFLVAVVGVYGVVAGMVIRRTPEIGVRMALGATQRHIVQIVTTPLAALTGLGLVIGGIGALGLSAVMDRLLFGLTGIDAITGAPTIGAIVGTVALGSLLPVLRAIGIDPAIALRAE